MRHLCLLVVLSIAFTSGACQRASAPLRVGINPWPGYQHINLAKSLGYFEAEGIEVELVNLMSNGEVNRAYSRGFVDVATSTASDLVTLRENYPLTPICFYVCDYSDGADVIITRKTNADFVALKGQRIGADVSALDMVHLLTALEFSGLQREDVVIVPMQQSDMIHALQDDEIDAAVTYPPVSNKMLESDAQLHIVFDTSSIPGTIVDLLVAEPRTLESRPEDLAAFVRAVNRAAMYAQLHPQEAHRIMGAATQLSAAEMAQSLDGLKLVSMQEQLELFRNDSALVHSIEKSMQILNVPADKYSPAAMLDDSILQQNQ